MIKSTQIFFILFFSLICIISKARGDVGVFTGTGRNLRQVSTESVQLVNINVTMIPQRGPFLFDGTVPGLDAVEYDCRFVLRNLTAKPCTIQVGFPIDSDFAQMPEGMKFDTLEAVCMYSFIVRDEKSTYHVDYEKNKTKGYDGRSWWGLFIWKMNFEASELKTLTVHYRLPMSMTLAETSKRGLGVDLPTPHAQSAEFLNGSILEFAGYTTETGSSWSGNVEKAAFTIITEPFERYLDHRGLFDSLPLSAPADAQEQMKKGFPVQHCWWYRHIEPTGWESIQNGVRWDYKDFKPSEPLRIRYYLTQFPRKAEEVNAWIDAILLSIENKNKEAEELAAVREMLLATYGREPTEATTRKVAEDQIWYHPKKDFDMANLNKEQQAILRQVDHRLGSVKNKK